MAMRSETSVGRAVVIIVVAGTALGLAHNWLGLKSHPVRGIAWVASEPDLPNLEALLAPKTGAAPVEPSVSPPPAPAKAGTAPPASQSAGPKTGSETGSAHAGVTPRAGASASPSHASDPSGSSATAAPPQAPASDQTNPVSTPGATPAPYIPDLGKPVQVGLTTVKGLFQGGAALFLDARDASEYDAGHIPGALRLTHDEALADPARVKALPVKGRPIVAYCEGGACEASLDLARTLVDAGYRKVLVYSGGFPEWSAAGMPVERSGGPKP